MQLIEVTDADDLVDGKEYLVFFWDIPEWSLAWYHEDELRWEFNDAPSDFVSLTRQNVYILPEVRNVRAGGEDAGS